MSTPRYRVDEKLKEWATPKQAEYIDAVNKHRSYAGASAELKLNKETIRQAIHAVEKKAAIFGYSPQHDLTKPVPNGYVVKGVSTLYDADGKAKAQWVKSKADPLQQIEIVKAAVDALLDGTPRIRAFNHPHEVNDKLCNVYTFTDCHVGMKSWARETGADWDLQIAEETLTGAFSYLINAMPKARLGVVAQLGDFLHFDSLTAVTPTNQHPLDADSRYSKVVQVAVRVLRNIVNEALKHHEQVILLIAEGNHDMAGSVWLRQMFKLLYENEPRVTLIDSELPYYCYQHGRTMIAWHHGHLKKAAQLPLLFAAQFPQMWGSTHRRYIHIGHRHHVQEQEHSGATVLQHATIASRDAYAARGGWIAERQITAITYHTDYGQVGRSTVYPEMLTR